jgi:hypothetical protein
MNQESAMAKKAESNGHSEAAPQDSTSRLPMIDLEESIKVVSKIREEALETAPMPEVAKKLGYAAATSTPFYRRITAARLFTLLSGKSALTQQAIDYIKPDDEQMKANVLTNAILGIPVYRDLITRYSGKKLNVALVANAIAKDCNLTDDCAGICARAFEASIRFAGIISSDGTVRHPVGGQPANEDGLSNLDKGGGQPARLDEGSGPPKKEDEAGCSHDIQKHTLFLDRDKSRSFIFTGPLEISRLEYQRICKWLEFTMLIIDEKSEGAATHEG